MKIQVTTDNINEVASNTVLIYLFEEVITANKVISIIDPDLSAHIATLIAEQPDCMKYGETTIIHTWGAITAKRIMLIGMGKKSDLTLDKIRSATGIAMRSAQKLHASSVATMLSDLNTEKFDPQVLGQTIVEGTILGTYQFNYYKTDPLVANTIQELIIMTTKMKQHSIIQQGVLRGKIIAESVTLTRDLVNHPAKYMTPTQMAVEAQKIAAECHLEINILDYKDMEQENMHALLAVAQGSAEEPKMIILKYIGDTKSKQMTAFVGKGVTFDSGGISIKPSLKMDEMKTDMAGGAAVLGTMLAIGKLKPQVNLLAVIPCTENMPSGKAYKPGDVISSMSGKTIEILSTDAEGRLILADAVTYAQKLGATQIIDIATLTGACVVAFGTITSGLLTNNNDFCDQLLAASKYTGEKMWELPNFPEYKEQIKSTIADIKNLGDRMGGAISAGFFIEKFINNIPWVHIDIAGTADSDKDNGYNVKGATGVGARTLIQLAENLGTHDC